MAISMASLKRVKATDPPRVLLYGPEKAGKTTLASEFPDPVFLQTEEGNGTLALDTFGKLTSYADVMDTLEGAVGDRAVLVGDRFTAADLYLGSQIGWGLQFGTIEKRPAFERYWAGLADRPAAVRARAIDDALIAS